MNPKILLFTFLCWLGALTQGLAQGGTIPVTGTVKDKSGAPLQDVTVSEKGRTSTVTTNAEGIFRISLSRRNASLIVSSVCFETQELRAADNLNVELAQSLKGLEEIRVVGYSTKRREQISSAVSVVSGEKLRDVTSNNLAGLLQGKAPGVVVSSGSGDPTSGSDVVIRGTGTINASTSPLYV